ncbi:hypothetical protein [Vibrio cholerae]|uniref:hypothetical protein n=1 Tax=Vibrio cholerae TaxID=666 RepID=UPI00155E68B3|nr:hypothetical protein [Vibrio cholerae]NOF48234.1 hypothetical protein [Vibrio cholerae]
MNKELEQAMALREEAKNLLKLVRDTNQESKERQASVRDLLDETREMHCQMLLGQRRVSLALTNLLPKATAESLALRNGNFITFIDTSSAAGDLVGLNGEIDNALRNRDIYDIVHAINVLAMANTDVVFIFTQFSAHVQGFEVYAISPQAYYSHDAPYPRLINKTVYLHWDNALERLLAIESQLTEMIIEAREAAEAKATEQAEVKA